jgi:hypothetical protein
MTNTQDALQARFVKLLGRYKAPKDFYDEVWRQCRQRVPSLRYGKEYKAEDLVDPELWGDDKGLHQLIGRCVAHLVATGRLALEFAGCPRCTNKRYLRI